MKKIVIIILISLALSSCATSKTKRKTDTTTTTEEKGTVESIRKADTLSYTVLNPIYKDTTIVVPNKENKSTLFIKYNEQGRQDISYLCDDINELKTYIKEQKEEKTENVKEKESDFKPIFILYIFLGLSFLIILSRLLKKIGI